MHFHFSIIDCIHSQIGTFHPVTVNFDLWLWPSNLTCIGWNTLNQLAKYVSERSFCTKVIVGTHRHTHTGGVLHLDHINVTVIYFFYWQTVSCRPTVIPFIWTIIVGLHFCSVIMHINGEAKFKTRWTLLSFPVYMRYKPAAKCKKVFDFICNL